MSMRRFAWAVWAAAAVVVLQVVWIQTDLGGSFATQAFSDLHPMPIIALGAWACWRRSRRETGRARRGWILLGAAISSWAFGESTWSVYELALGREVPFPSLADVGYLGMIPLAAAAVLSFPTAGARITSAVRTLLDGLIISASLFFIGWATILGPMYRASSGSALEQTLGLAYPAGDLVIIGVVLFIAARTREGRIPFALIGSGLASLAIADGGFAYLTLHDSYGSGNLIDVGWTAGFLLIWLAALRPAPTAQRSIDDERPSRLGSFLPYGAAVLAVGVGAVQKVRAGVLEPVLFWGMMAVVLLVIVRQLLLLIDNFSLTRNLEDKVQARTAELEAAVRQLAEAQKLQDAFVASVSHELRTPLTTMLGASATMMRPQFPLAEEARALASIANRGAERMSRLVEDLLIASGLTEGVRCARVPLDVAAELQNVLSSYAPAGKTVSTRIPLGLRAIGDPERFRVIVQHLLSNADKFAPDGTTIHISACTRGEEVSVAVRDEGPGVPAALHEKVFERFFQVDATDIRTHYGGVGLGLYIARRLAAAMGGRLSIEGNVSRGGATFVLTLGAAEAGAPKDGSPASAFAQAG